MHHKLIKLVLVDEILFLWINLAMLLRTFYIFATRINLLQIYGESKKLFLHSFSYWIFFTKFKDLPLNDIPLFKTNKLRVRGCESGYWFNGISIKIEVHPSNLWNIGTYPKIIFQCNTDGVHRNGRRQPLGGYQIMKMTIQIQKRFLQKIPGRFVS